MSRGKKITEEEKQFIKVNLLAKRSIADIANDLGRHYFTVYKIATNQFGYKTAHEFTTQEDMFIRHAYRSGMKAQYIATKLHVDVSQIYNRVKKLKIKKGKAVKGDVPPEPSTIN